MKLCRVLLLVLVCSGLGLQAQTPSAIVRGHVTDQGTGLAMKGASVELLSDTTPIGTTSDSLGVFLLDASPGQYALRVRYVGYEELIVPEVWARAGKEVVLNVSLDIALNELEPFTVSATARTELTPLGTRTFTVEQSLRYPATFFDPVRMATTTAGVVAANDQANHLIIRGNSPNANNWTLEGVEIVSPNHLSNAGTANDLPTLSGGGVNILSAQMLSTSQLHVGVLPMQFGNATGGIMDMRLRSGNNTQQEWTAQAGLIGIDLSAEGPLGKKGGASYLVNYRYSTLGLLSEMGVDLGDEVIKFQDIAAHVTVPIGKRSELRLIGMGGNSSNEFEAVRDTAEWEFDKDGSDITYDAMTGIVGGELLVGVGKRGKWTTTAFFSFSEQQRDRTFLDSSFAVVQTSAKGLEERKTSLLSRYQGAVGGRLKYTVGGTATERTVNNLFDETTIGWLVRPFTDVSWSLTERLQLDLGIGYSHFTFNGSKAVEPRGALHWKMKKARRITLSAGRRSMLPWHQIMYVRFSPVGNWNENVGLTLSDDVVLGYDHPFSSRSSIHCEIYLQQLSNVPHVNERLHFFFPEEIPQLGNSWDEFSNADLTNRGHATNVGGEVSYARSFANELFYQLNVTVFDSRYGGDDGRRSDTRWNSNYTANAMGGKEWSKTKESKIRTWGLSARLGYAGGLRYTPIDMQSGTLDRTDPYGSQLNDTYRLDLRIYLKKDRKGRTGVWALDLQNATNAQNEAYRYYDNRKGEVVTKYQLGIIPNLSYRIEF